MLLVGVIDDSWFVKIVVVVELVVIMRWCDVLKYVNVMSGRNIV